MKKEAETEYVSIVTGASSGLGKAIATLLAEKGHKVYVVARRRNLLQKLQKECKKCPGKIIAVTGDLSDAKFRKNLITQIFNRERKIDFLFNNAGFGRSTLLENQKPDEIQKMFEVNVIAYEHLASLALSSMKRRNKGRIINIGSVVAFTPLPYFSVYNSTKAAVYNFNRSLRYELKNSNVSSTVVLPARMKTGFAHNAYDCYSSECRTNLAINFNKIAGDPFIVAKKIIKNMHKGKEVILPTLKSFLWYSSRYFGWIVDLAMKHILGPRELKRIKSDKHNQ